MLLTPGCSTEARTTPRVPFICRSAHGTQKHVLTKSPVYYKSRQFSVLGKGRAPARSQAPPHTLAAG